MRLNNRHMQLFSLVLRYGLGTIDAFHRRLFPDSQLNSVAKVTARLLQGRFLHKYPLLHPRCYYRLGPEAVRLLSHDV